MCCGVCAGRRGAAVCGEGGGGGGESGSALGGGAVLAGCALVVVWSRLPAVAPSLES
jgi:hypothetical protein